MNNRLFPPFIAGLVAVFMFSVPFVFADSAGTSSQGSVGQATIEALIHDGAWEELYARSADGLVARPDDSVLWRGKIRALRQLGYVAAARKTLRQARTIHPEDADLLLEEVWLSVIAEDWPKVLADTELPASQTEVSGELLLLRGIALRETGDVDGGIALFTRLLDRNPDDCIALTNRGRLLAQADRNEAALADLAVATACADHPEPFFLRGGLLSRLGRQAEAEADLTSGLNLDPGNLSGLLARSEVCLLRNDIAGAVRDLKIARRLASGDPRVEALACRLAGVTSEWDAVAGCAEQSATLAPENPEVWRTLGKVRLESGNLEGSIAAYDTLVTLAPDDPRYRLERATVLLMRGDYATAAADCSAVIDKQPLATAYALRALAYYRAENFIQADEDCSNALVLDRNEQTALLVRANLALGRNELDQATDDCERAFRQSSGSLWGVVTCSRAHLQAGRLERAAYYTERAKEIAPHDPETTALVAKIAAVPAEKRPPQEGEGLQEVESQAADSILRNGASQSIEFSTGDRNPGQTLNATGGWNAISAGEKRLINMLNSTSSKHKRDAAKAIVQGGSVSEAVYEAVAAALTKMFGTGARDELSVDTMAWLCRALGSSGNAGFLEALERVAVSDNKKLAKYANNALRNLR